MKYEDAKRELRAGHADKSSDGEGYKIDGLRGAMYGLDDVIICGSTTNEIVSEKY